MKKLAILDTDFISKGHIVRAGEDDHLIDQVLRLPDYQFFCHEQTKDELVRYNSHAPVWLEEKVKGNSITIYSDGRIIREMKDLYFRAGLTQYTALLKNACDAFDRDYFRTHYAELVALDPFNVSEAEYLKTLSDLDSAIGEGNNLGEIKEYVLLQWLNTLNEGPVFYFCSDDRNARNGVLSVEGIKVQCISLISAFQRLKAEGVFTAESAKPYVDAVLNYYKESKQDNIRVVEASRIGRYMRVPCEQVVRELFEDRYMELPNGMLKYREDDTSGE